MKKKHLTTVFQYFCIGIVAGCISCATSPNRPFHGPMPENFRLLSRQNSILAEELAKLPEFQDGIDSNEERALECLFNAYSKEIILFDQAFEEMYLVGKPEVRKYCSPLQALFWIAINNDEAALIKSVSDYSLNAVLDESWKFNNVSAVSDDRIEQILQGIRDEDVKTDYIARRPRLTPALYKNELVKLYKKNKGLFSKKARAIIELMIDDRWEDFDIVTDRLNAPQLIDYYEKKRFRYTTQLPWTRDRVASPYYVFKYNEMDCKSCTKFTIYCLKKSGYKANELLLPGTNAPFHSVCLFEMNGEKFIMDNGRPTPNGVYHYRAIKQQD